MSQRKGNLMGIRKDIQVLDATIRDGGLCNNFEFSDEFVSALYKMNVRCGIDYMEFGYKASKNMFKESDFGKWKFCNEEDIRAIVGDNRSDMKISVMADVGRCDYLTDFLPKEESVIDMVRVACYIHQISTAIEMIEHLHSLGYETACNIMAISQASHDQVEMALQMLSQSSVDVIYLVDSYGSLYPENASELAIEYVNAVEGTGKKIGFTPFASPTAVSPIFLPVSKSSTTARSLPSISERRASARAVFCIFPSSISSHIVSGSRPFACTVAERHMFVKSFQPGRSGFSS